MNIILETDDGKKEEFKCYGFVLSMAVDDPDDPDSDSCVVQVIHSNNTDAENLVGLAKDAHRYMLKQYIDEVYGEEKTDD